MNNVKAILACSLDFGIGFENSLPWPKQSEDMVWFKKHTTGNVVLMGRSTWESLGKKPLPGRTNIVVSTKNISGPDLVDSGDMGNILARACDKYPEKTIWVIGGEDVYKQALPFCDEVYLTMINTYCAYDRSIDPASILEGFPNVSFLENHSKYNFQIRSR